MDRTKLLALLAVLVLAATYAAASLWVGFRVDDEVQRLATTLAASDEVQVARLEYERGVRAGTLHYDLRWRGRAGEPVAEALRETGVLPPEGLRIAGALQVRHGPWVGRGAGFALAGGEERISLPDVMRPYLPEYVGDAPALRLTARVTLGGKLELRFVAQDYRGRAGAPEWDERLRLELVGLEGRVRTDSRLDRFALDLRLAQFSLAGRDAEEEFEFAMLGVHTVLDAFEARPLVWTGTSSLALARLSMRLPGQILEMQELAAASDTWVDDGMLHSSSTMAAGPLRFGEHVLPGGSVTATWRDVDADALSEMARLMESARGGAGDAPAAATQPQMAAQIDRVLAGRPSLAIDPLTLSLAAPGDIEGRLFAAFESEARLSFQQLDTLTQALRIDAELQVQTSALRFVAGLFASEQLPPDATTTERSTQLEAIYLEMLTGIEGVPFIEARDGHFAVSMQVRDGRVLVGGIELMTIDSLAAMAEAALAGLFRGHDDGQLIPWAEPAYGRVSLHADFEPDPFVIQVVAGGDHDLEALVGYGCVGWVNGDRPDLVLRYEAGVLPLYIYANAGLDTTLAVLDPLGRWHCNDDGPGRGLNPGVEVIDPASGDYAIWLGAFGSGATAAWLYISELGMTVE